MEVRRLEQYIVRPIFFPPDNECLRDKKTLVFPGGTIHLISKLYKTESGLFLMLLRKPHLLFDLGLLNPHM